MNEAPAPKPGVKTTEFWVIGIVAAVTLVKGFTGDAITPEETEAVSGATATFLDAAVQLGEVLGPIFLAVYYTVSRGKLKSNTVRYLAKLAGDK